MRVLVALALTLLVVSCSKPTPTPNTQLPFLPLPFLPGETISLVENRLIGIAIVEGGIDCLSFIRAIGGYPAGGSPLVAEKYLPGIWTVRTYNKIVEELSGVGPWWVYENTQSVQGRGQRC